MAQKEYLCADIKSVETFKIAITDSNEAIKTT